MRDDASRGFLTVGALRVGRSAAATATLGPTGRIGISQYNLDFSESRMFELPFRPIKCAVDKVGSRNNSAT